MKLCSDGLLWEAQIFDCEPYDATLQVRQCFRCFKYGHIARYCKAPQRCGICAATAHQGGEDACPEKDGSGKKRCLNCSGQHVAWERSCPVAKKERERIGEAYARRPRQFEVRSGLPNPQTPPTDVGDGFVEVRRQGRPLGGSKARREEQERSASAMKDWMNRPQPRGGTEDAHPSNQ